jgi:hypothetical protein
LANNLVDVYTLTNYLYCVYIFILLLSFYILAYIVICLIIYNIYDTLSNDIIFKLIIFLCGIALWVVFICIRCFIIGGWIGIVLMLIFKRILDWFIKLMLRVRIGFGLIIV